MEHRCPVDQLYCVGNSILTFQCRWSSRWSWWRTSVRPWPSCCSTSSTRSSSGRTICRGWWRRWRLARRRSRRTTGSSSTRSCSTANPRGWRPQSRNWTQRFVFSSLLYYFLPLSMDGQFICVFCCHWSLFFTQKTKEIAFLLAHFLWQHKLFFVIISTHNSCSAAKQIWCSLCSNLGTYLLLYTFIYKKIYLMSKKINEESILFKLCWSCWKLVGRDVALVSNFYNWNSRDEICLQW